MSVKKILPKKEEIKASINSILKKYEEKSSKNEYKNYREQEECLDNLFEKVYPNNSNLSEVLAKVACLNAYYSTNVLALNKMANHITEIKNLDERLKNGDETLISEISQIEGINRKFYSFATKYCFRYNKNAFPLFDSNVEYVLNRFIIENSLDYKKKDLRNYTKLKKIIKNFREHYDLSETEYPIRNLDHFMWIYGKEKRPKSEGKY